MPSSEMSPALRAHQTTEQGNPASPGGEARQGARSSARRVSRPFDAACTRRESRARHPSTCGTIRTRLSPRVARRVLQTPTPPTATRLVVARHVRRIAPTATTKTNHARKVRTKTRVHWRWWRSKRPRRRKRREADAAIHGVDRTEGNFRTFRSAAPRPRRRPRGERRVECRARGGRRGAHRTGRGPCQQRCEGRPSCVQASVAQDRGEQGATVGRVAQQRCGVPCASRKTTAPWRGFMRTEKGGCIFSGDVKVRGEMPARMERRR